MFRGERRITQAKRGPRMNKCPFCQSMVTIIERIANRDCFEIECARCGAYEISGTCFSIGLPADAHLISGVLRWRKELGFTRGDAITSDSIKDLLASSEIPITIPDKVDKLIMFLGLKSKTFNAYIPLRLENDYSLTYSPNIEELRAILLYLKNENLISSEVPIAKDVPNPVALTMKGWERFYELEKKKVNSKQCFIAMNFSDDFNAALRAITETINECGYDAYCVKGLQHNDDISDLIVAGIKKSRFVIAEFSGERPSAYYEAGYAKGLGRDVIWMAREGEKLHFDTRQYNHIIWKDEADLKLKLRDRIEATIK